MLNEKCSEFFAGRFDDVLTARLDRMLEERDECCLIGNIFVTQSTSTAHSLCAALVMVILQMRQELMHAAPGRSIGSDRVKLLIDASVLLCSVFPKSSTFNIGLKRIDKLFGSHDEIRTGRRARQPTPIDSHGCEEFWVVPACMRANPPPIELRHWDYFRRVLGIAAEGLPCSSKQPDDLKQRLKDAIKKWKCDADVFNDVKACRDAFSHFDFDFSFEDFPEVKGAGGGGGCVASADHAKEPITVNLCFERVRKMLGVTKCEVSSKQLDDLFRQWEAHAELNKAREGGKS
jgi:hypothetical protein